MREIKFRAWVGDGYMYEPTIDFATMECIDVYTDYTCDEDGEEYPVDVIGRDKWEIEQFTGLRDKNGREIYEGDIVVVENWCFHAPVVVVEWEDERTGFIPFSINSSEEYANGDDCQVIGNIHENPELVDWCENGL